MENTFDLRKYLVENELTPNSKFIKEQQLSPEEQKVVDYILGGLEEGVFDDVLQRVKTAAKKGILTAAMVTALLAAPNLTQAQKTQIQNAASTEMTTTQNASTAASTSIPGTIKTISYSENFASGKATLTNKDVLAKNVEEMKKFLNGKDTSQFKVVIVAGESQVTNPKGFEKKGSLAQARAKAIENEIKGLGFKTVDIQTKIGTTPYKPGNDVNDPKYQEEQFVTINIVVDNDICGMKPVSTNEGQGVESKNYVTFEEYLSGKGNLVMSTGTIPDRLVVLDANGNIKQDTGYTTTKIKDGDWQYTPLYVLELTKAYMKGNISMKDIDPKTIITVKDKYDLYNKLKKATVNNPSLEGSEVNGPLKEMEGMIKKGINTFVIYNIGTSNIKLNFDDSKGDVEAKVYSPVGKTGYSIAASCTR